MNVSKEWKSQSGPIIPKKKVTELALNYRTVSLTIMTCKQDIRENNEKADWHKLPKYEIT